MKPSEFIKKYRHTHNGNVMCNVCNDLALQKIEAVIAWLDEEYEKNNAVRCSSSMVLDSYPAQYNCDTCGTHWTANDATPICKGKS